MRFPRDRDSNNEGFRTTLDLEHPPRILRVSAPGWLTHALIPRSMLDEISRDT